MRDSAIAELRTKSTATHHFRVLHDSGLIHLTDCGNRKGVLLRRAESTGDSLDCSRAELVTILMASTI